MSTELKSKLSVIFPQLTNHPEAVEGVVNILEGKMWNGLDFPHQLHHNFRVFSDAMVISSLQNSEKWERMLLEKGSIVHDIGRNFVEKGLLKEEEHQNGSFILAKAIAILEWKYDEDLANYFAEGIALHVNDVLQKNR